MERISSPGRLLGLLIALLLLSACAPARTPPFGENAFLEGSDYQLLIEQGTKEDVLSRYAGFFEEILEREDHPEGAAIRFRFRGILYQATLVPDDLSGGDWALFFVRP